MNDLAEVIASMTWIRDPEMGAGKSNKMGGFKKYQ
jgi:hypothetical protein